MILFVDEYSRMIYTYFMKNNSEAFSGFSRYRVLVENHLGKNFLTKNLMITSSV